MNRIKLLFVTVFASSVVCLAAETVAAKNEGYAALKDYQATAQASSPIAAADKSTTTAPVAAPSVPMSNTCTKEQIPDNDPPGTVRVVGAETDIAGKYKFLIPKLPIPPFSMWRQWFDQHAISVHCALEWKDDKGKWWHGEMRSASWDKGSYEHRVGVGQFTATGYIAYAIFIFEDRVPRFTDELGRPVVTTVDEVVKCDYKKVAAEIRNYAAYGMPNGAKGTDTYGKHNAGMGGPSYKPAQNSNTFVNYVLRKCGVCMPAPDRAVGWDTEPYFPYSSNAHYPQYDN